jgi:hypothetical protein
LEIFKMEKTGLIGVLRTMGERDVYLHGDPSGQVPLFLLPLRPRRRVKLPKAEPVEARAEYCAELLKRGLIEPMTAGVAFGDWRFRISDSGRALLLDLDRRKGSA